MPFCQKCGTEVTVNAAFCGACGISIANAEIQPSVIIVDAPPITEVSESWKKKFALIEKAGGVGFPKWRELTYGEKNVIRINLWALVFGPFYYIALGMWKKGAVIFFLCIATLMVLDLTLEHFGREMSATLNYVTAVIYAQRATLDYYKKVVLGDDGWW
jgi:hypothetical protein